MEATPLSPLRPRGVESLEPAWEEGELTDVKAECSEPRENSERTAAKPRPSGEEAEARFARAASPRLPAVCSSARSRVLPRARELFTCTLVGGGPERVENLCW